MLYTLTLPVSEVLRNRGPMIISQWVLLVDALKHIIMCVTSSVDYSAIRSLSFRKPDRRGGPKYYYCRDELLIRFI